MITIRNSGLKYETLDNGDTRFYFPNGTNQQKRLPNHLDFENWIQSIEKTAGLTQTTDTQLSNLRKDFATVWNKNWDYQPIGNNNAVQLPVLHELSQFGLENLISCLNMEEHPTENSDGDFSIGYNYFLSAAEVEVYQNSPWTEPFARQMLLNDLKGSAILDVQTLVRVPVSQEQFDALVASRFVMGSVNFAASGICAAINRNDIETAANIRLSYNSTAGEYDNYKGFVAGVQAMGIAAATIENRVPNVALVAPSDGLAATLPTFPQSLLRVIRRASNARARKAIVGSALLAFADHYTRGGQFLPTVASGGYMGWNSANLFNALKQVGLQVKSFQDFAKTLPKTSDQLSAVQKLQLKNLINRDETVELAAAMIDTVYLPDIVANNRVIDIRSILARHDNPRGWTVGLDYGYYDERQLVGSTLYAQL